MKRRFLSMLLALVLIVSMAVPAFAATVSDSGYFEYDGLMRKYVATTTASSTYAQSTMTFEKSAILTITMEAQVSYSTETQVINRGYGVENNSQRVTASVSNVFQIDGKQFSGTISAVSSIFNIQKKLVVYQNL